MAGKSRGVVVKWACRIASILALMTVLAGFGVYSWMQSYLHSDDFRTFMGQEVGGFMQADAEFERFEWQGMDVRTSSFKAKRGQLVQSLAAEGVQARLSLAGVRRGVWEVSDLRVSQLDLQVATENAQSLSPKNGSLSNLPDEGRSVETSKAKGKRGFLAGLLPDRAELLSADVMSMNFELSTSRGGLKAADTMMRVDAGQSEGSYDLNFSGGMIDSDWFGSTLDLESARAKYKDGRFFLTESKSSVFKRGQLELSGEVEGREFGFFGVLTDVRSEELVPSAWKRRLTGDVETKFKVQSGSRNTAVRGELELKNGVLTSLPVLDRIAAYANTRRFQRLNLSEAKLKFHREGERLELTNIVLASEGLVRLEGRLSVIDGQLNGRFNVGIVPGTLAHIPGAESKVFLRGKDGLLWSPLAITGTVDHPKEDLSDRMIAAAGERMFELIPETGLMALKFAHDTATELPGKAVESAPEVIREGADVIQSGVRSVFDLIPGGE